MNDVHDILGGRLAEALDLHVVLIAPEVGHHHQRRRFLAEHRRDQHPGLLGDVAPVLDPGLVTGGVTPGGDIAQGPHVRLAGAAVLVAEHPVVHRDPATHQPVGGRPGADTHHHQVGDEFGAVGEHHRFHVPRSANLGHSDTGAHVDPFGAVHPGDEFADLLPQHSGQRGGLRLDENHVHPEPAQRGGDLAADEPRADDDRAARAPGMLAQFHRVAEGPQHPDAGQIGERRYPPGYQSGGDHQVVVAQLGAVDQGDGARARVQRAGGLAQPHRDVVLGVELGGPQ